MKISLKQLRSLIKEEIEQMASSDSTSTVSPGDEVKVDYEQRHGYGVLIYWGNVKSVDEASGTAQVELFAMHFDRVPLSTWKQPNQTVTAFLPGHGLKRAAPGTPADHRYRAGKYYISNSYYTDDGVLTNL